VEDAECKLLQLPKKILPLQAQNAHNILLNKLFNAHKKNNIRHNRNRKPLASISMTVHHETHTPNKYKINKKPVSVIVQ